MAKHTFPADDPKAKDKEEAENYLPLEDIGPSVVVVGKESQVTFKQEPKLEKPEMPDVQEKPQKPEVTHSPVKLVRSPKKIKEKVKPQIIAQQYERWVPQQNGAKSPERKGEEIIKPKEQAMVEGGEKEAISKTAKPLDKGVESGEYDI